MAASLTQVLSQGFVEPSRRWLTIYPEHIVKHGSANLPPINTGSIWVWIFGGAVAGGIIGGILIAMDVHNERVLAKQRALERQQSSAMENFIEYQRRAWEVQRARLIEEQQAWAMEDQRIRALEEQRARDLQEQQRVRTLEEQRARWAQRQARTVAIQRARALERQRARVLEQPHWEVQHARSFVQIVQEQVAINRAEEEQRLNAIQKFRQRPINLEECTICFDPLRAFSGTTQQEVAMLVCGHTFHNVCIMRWLQASDECPVCRTNAASLNIENVTNRCTQGRNSRRRRRRNRRQNYL